MSDHTQSDLLDAVKAHAREHYNDDGWDVIVEAFENDDLLKLIEDARTPEEAIAKVAAYVNVRHEITQDIIGAGGGC